jgi:hypothetical protein
MERIEGCMSLTPDIVCRDLCGNCRQHQLQGSHRYFQERVDKAIQLLTALGYRVVSPEKALEESWRASPDRMGGQFTDEEISRGNNTWI